MSVCHIERPLEIGRTDFVEKPMRLGDVMGDVVDLGVFGFTIVVLKEDDDFRSFCSVY